MLFSLLFTALAGLATAKSPCQQFPYNDLLFLSDYSVAQSYCTKNYPVAPQTSTSTAPVSTITSVAPATTTTSTVLPQNPTTTLPVVTIVTTVATTTSYTTVATSTITVTVPTSTISTTVTTSTFTSLTSTTNTETINGGTVTSYTTTYPYGYTGSRKRDLEEREHHLSERGASCAWWDWLCIGWQGVVTREKAFVGTFCSCIETPQTIYSAVDSRLLPQTVTPSTTVFSTPTSTVTYTVPVSTVSPSTTQSVTYTVVSSVTQSITTTETPLYTTSITAQTSTTSTLTVLRTNTKTSTVSTTTHCPQATPSVCSNRCTNLQTDNSNCGTCGTACPSYQICQSGSCVTPSYSCTPQGGGGNTCGSHNYCTCLTSFANSAQGVCILAKTACPIAFCSGDSSCGAGGACARTQCVNSPGCFPLDNRCATGPGTASKRSRPARMEGVPADWERSPSLNERLSSLDS